MFNHPLALGVFLLISFAPLLGHEEKAPTEAVESKASLIWNEDFEQASKEAYKLKKPLLLYFSGSDWCRWCQKIHQEVLSSEEFTHYLADFFIFVQVDFPKNFIQKTRIIQQNTDLKNRYKVRSFPTIILLDHEQKELDRLGYIKGGGKIYREKIFQILKDYEIYRESILKLQTGHSENLDLQKLYRMAQKFHYHKDIQKILEEGLIQKEAFFQVEKYLYLSKEGKRKTQKALQLKNQVLDSDPEDLEGWHYRFAVIDFEANLRDSELSDILLTLKPLTDYLSRFSHLENKNAWKIHMTVAQTLIDHQRHKEALSYAKQALYFSPASRKKEVQQTVQYIEHLVVQQSNEGNAFFPAKFFFSK